MSSTRLRSRTKKASGSPSALGRNLGEALDLLDEDFGGQRPEVGKVAIERRLSHSGTTRYLAHGNVG